MESFTVIVAGVGGMGVMRLSQIIAGAAHSTFPFVCRTEAKGLSQRGGPALSAVRFGTSRLVPSLGTGCEDLLISLDAIETLRLLPTTRLRTQCLTNAKYQPTAFLSAEGDEAEKWRETIRSTLLLQHCVSIDLEGIAKSEACVGCENIILMGAASQFLPITPESLLSEACSQIRRQDAALIERAFNAGVAALAKRA